jgi:hypothetical protein
MNSGPVTVELQTELPDQHPEAKLDFDWKRTAKRRGGRDAGKLPAAAIAS